MTVRVQDRDAIRTITIDRPDKHNSLTGRMLTDMAEAVVEAGELDEIRVIVIRGGETAFSTGANLEAYAEYGALEARQSNLETWMRLFEALESSDKPVVASVAGYAIAGGTELVLACDLVVAADDATFGLVEARVGVIPGAGASVRLTRWVGRAHAKEILMLGDTLTAEEAARIGLVNRVVPAQELESTTAELAEKLASRSPLALAAAKRVVNVGGEMSLSHGIQYALGEFALLFAADDQKEGMSAFLEKRPPSFKGK